MVGVNGSVSGTARQTPTPLSQEKHPDKGDHGYEFYAPLERVGRAISHTFASDMRVYKHTRIQASGNDVGHV